jgi:phosphoribosylformylglycinamidine cyclo-ligase
MYRVLNCGVGMVLSIDADKADEALSILKAEGENAWIIGEICPRNRGKDVLISDLETQA